MDLMEWGAFLGNLGEFVGSFAVLATLVYLAVQTRQTGQLIRAQVVQSSADSLREIYLPFTDLQFSAGLIAACTRGDDEPFNHTHELATIGWLLAATKAFETQFLLRNQGVLDEQVWEAWSYAALGAYRTEFALDWWRSIGRSYVTPAFAAYLDDRFEQTVGWLPFSANMPKMPGDADFSEYQRTERSD